MCVCGRDVLIRCASGYAGRAPRLEPSSRVVLVIAVAHVRLAVRQPVAAAAAAAAVTLAVTGGGGAPAGVSIRQQQAVAHHAALALVAHIVIVAERQLLAAVARQPDGAPHVRRDRAAVPALTQ